MAPSDEILEERRLIRQCQEGDQAAWFELFRRYYQCVVRSARRFLRGEGWNDDLVEEMTAEVWASLGINHGKRLCGYDPYRSRFATFLASRTWQVVALERQKRQCRRRHEVQRGPRAPEPAAGVLAVEVLECCLREFLATLQEWEAAFFRDNVLRLPDPRIFTMMSRGCFNKRVERLVRKFKTVLHERGFLLMPEETR